MNKLIFLITFLLLFALTLKAQQLPFFKPTIFKHIPSSESYNIMQDSKGYIWFSTEAGLCKYNGNSIKVFESKNGLPEGGSYTVSEDKDGAIWITTVKNRLLKYTDDTLKEVFLNREQTTLFKNNLQLIYLSKPINNNLWLTSQFYTYIIDMRTGKGNPFHLKDTNSSYYFIKHNGALTHVKYQKSPVILVNPFTQVRNLKFTIEDGTKIHSFLLPLSDHDIPSWRVYTASNNSGENYIAFGNTLISIHPDYSHEVHKVDNLILAMYIDKDNGLWLGMQKGGICYYPGSISEKNKIVSLNDLSVSGICEDSEHGIWCTTLEKGVFYCRNKGVIDYSNIKGLDEKAELLKNLTGKIYVSGEKDEMIIIKNIEIKKVRLPNTKSTVNTDIIKYGSNYIISNKGHVTYCDTSFKNFKPVKINEKSNFGVNQLSAGKNGKVYGYQFGSLFEIQNFKALIRINKLPSPGKCILFSSDGRLLLGTKEGLYRVDINNFSINKIIGIEGVISKIIEIKGEIWVTTSNNGIYLIRNKKVSHISDELGLNTRRFTDIKQDKLGNIWLASNIGIILLKKNKDTYSNRIYNSSHGLLSNEIFGLECNDTLLYASTNDGLCSFPLNYDLKNNTPPKLRLNSVYLNNQKVIKINSLQSLEYNQNNINFDFDILTFKQIDSPSKLIYTLNEENKKNYNDGNILKLNNIAPGKYTLNVYALNNDGVRSKEPVRIDFEIKKPFWKTALFIIACIFLFGFLVFLIVKNIIKGALTNEKEKSRVTKLIAEYQMSALRAQMNPHFIFNCINSIQGYILTNKPQQAYNYLSKFSKLIRLVLNNAEENLITLGEEIKIVGLYIELEQERFENKFTYSISLPENLNDAKIPAMILQPYVENAIWHGLMNMTGEGERHISIKVKKLNTVLEIIIEDNGVGRKQAALFSPSNHKPKATSINNKRTEILNVLSSNKGRITIEDIKNDEIIMGTRVIIHIPETDNND